MCKFSSSLAPPPAPQPGTAEALDNFLNDTSDDFNWFDAIDAIDDAELGLEAGQLQQASRQVPQETSDGEGSSKLEAAASGSDNASSYDLVEMFKQQVEQQQQQQQLTALPLQQTALPPTAVAGGPFPASASFSAPYGAALMQQPMMCGMAPAFAACMPGAFLGGGPLTPSSVLLPPAAVAMQLEPAATTAGAPAGFSSAQCTDASATTAAPAAHHATTAGDGSAACPSRKSSRASKTQEEVEAAVERIKQKRRESAQRSRARKNEYMRQLEVENQALKDEVQRLQHVLATLQRSAYAHPAAALVPLAAL